jgi:outer membrane protein OmpA-like peptidoglycan-associated protein
MKQNLSAQRASYRQGLVLGLTMAEIMLLMVFTLLLVAGALLQKSQTRIAGLERDANVSAAQLAELRSLREKLARTARVPLPDNWLELIRINEDLKRLPPDSTDARSVLQVFEAVDRTRKAIESLGYGSTDLRQMPETILKNMPPAGQTKPEEKSGHNWPPIIRLSEADNYFFELGKAEISPGFRDRLINVVIPRLLELISAYDVDVIEVIGHTDEVPIAGLRSNLDERLVDALQGRSPVEDLMFSDNAGLAMARASAVARVLMEDDRLKPFRILPLSGAQVITTEERVSEGGPWHETASRRRIEIRLRRTSSVVQ